MQSHRALPQIKTDFQPGSNPVTLSYISRVDDSSDSDFGQKEYWYLDSGCSNHLTWSREHFQTYEELSDGKRIVERATGQKVSAKGIGNAVIQVYNPTKKKDEFVTLSNVLHVVECECSLLSVRQLAQTGLCTLFTEDYALILQDGNIEIARGGIHGKLYFLSKAIRAADNANTVIQHDSNDTNYRKLQLWHKRLGHADIRYVQQLANRNLADGMNMKLRLPPKQERCVDCVIGKMPQLPFKVDDKIVTGLLELIYMDLCGPMKTMSVGGSRYMMIVTDARSRMRYVYFLKKKVEALEYFKEYHIMAEKKTGQKLMAVRSDNGGEFVNGEFRKYFKNHGIEQQLTAPYTPQEDGVSEVSNRIIISKANTILHAANAPKSLWAEAVMTAIQLTNITPSKGSQASDDGLDGINTTPYEIWYGRKPQVGHLRVWGCFAYRQTPKETRTDAKWDIRAEKCAFIGYTSSTKQWKLFNPITKKSHITRDVVFYEDKYYWRHKTDNRSNSNSSSKNKATNRVSELSKNEDLIIFPPSRIVTVSDDSESELPQEEESDSELSDINSENVQHDQQESEYHSQEDKIQEELRTKDKSQTSTNVPGAFDIPELRSDLGAAWDPPVGKRQPKPADKANMILEAKLEEMASTQIDPACMVTNGPKSMRLALESTDSVHWRREIETEIGTLEGHKTWLVVNNLPSGKTAVTSRIVLQKKLGIDGSVERFKARLVAHGFKQRPDIDYHSTYAPLIGLPAIRLGLSAAAARDDEIDQIDVVGAFLESPTEEEIYIELPKGFSTNKNGKVVLAEDDNSPRVIVRLLKSLYGLRQSALNWYATLHQFLLKNGFSPSTVEPGVYFQQPQTGRKTGFTIIVWVDDILLIGKRPEINAMKSKISSRFKVKDLGPISHFLGMRVTRNRENRTVYIDQKSYVQQIIERFRMDSATPVSTPVDRSIIMKKRKDSDPSTSQLQYQEAVGSINYAAIVTRPDISFAAGMLGRYSANPSKVHWEAVKRVLKYLKKILHYGLELGGGIERDSNQLEAYGDADFAGDRDELKSTTGFVAIDRHGSVVAWNSTKQKITAKSTADAEFTATAFAIEEAVWLQKLEAEFHGNLTEKPVTIYNDNTACIANLTKNEYSPPNRHVGVRYWWIRDVLRLGEANIKHVDTSRMKADGLTKGLDKIKHERFINDMKLRKV
jgi:hypothetical protein